MAVTLQAQNVEINAANFPDEKFRRFLSSQYDYEKDGILNIMDIQSLYLYDYGISSLKGIEFFTALTYLVCDNNQLTSLDVSKNTALTTLSCHDNQLTSLDISNNTALIHFQCYQNQLKGITMDMFINSLPTSSNNPYLTIRQRNNESNVCTQSQFAAIAAKG